VRLDDNPSVRDLLAQVKASALAAFSHQELPFDQVVEALQPVRSLSYSPLFQSVFIFDKVAVERTMTLPGVVLTPMDVPRASAHFDVSLALSDGEEGYSGEIEYASDLFERATVERFTGHFVTLIEGMVASDDAHVAALPLLTAEQERQLLVDFNDTARPELIAATWPELFAAQVAALRGEYRCISYDHRGQGRSDDTNDKSVPIEQVYDDLVALIESLDAGPVHLVGLSMGGFAAMRVAARRPDLLRSVVLLDTSCDAESWINLPEYKLLNFVAALLGVRSVAPGVMKSLFGRTALQDPARAA
jgi:hypothetical protein